MLLLLKDTAGPAGDATAASMGVSWSMGVADDEPTAEVDSVSGMAGRAGVLAPLALALTLALES